MQIKEATVMQRARKHKMNSLLQDTEETFKLHSPQESFQQLSESPDFQRRRRWVPECCENQYHRQKELWSMEFSITILREYLNNNNNTMDCGSSFRVRILITLNIHTYIHSVANKLLHDHLYNTKCGCSFGYLDNCTLPWPLKVTLIHWGEKNRNRKKLIWSIFTS